jgi:iron complex transport system substrate-binding protein
VLAADITAPEQIEALNEVGLTVFALPNPTDLPGMYENLRTVALLTGHEAETEVLIADYEGRVTAVTETVSAAAKKPLVFYEIDGTDANAPWTSGSGTFVDTLITMSGGDNVGAVLDGAWAQISVEELIAQNPDIIILGDFTWGGVTPEDVAARESWAGLTAVQEGKIYTFDDNLVSRPGPRLVEGLENMAALLHPELFE